MSPAEGENMLGFGKAGRRKAAEEKGFINVVMEAVPDGTALLGELGPRAAASEARKFCGVPDDFPVRLIILGDRYRKYLGDREDSQEEREKFTESLGETDAAEIWEEEGMGSTMYTVFCPVAVSGDTPETSGGNAMHMFLNAEQRKKIAAVFSEIYSVPEKDVFVSGYVSGKGNTVRAADLSEDQAEIYFDGGEPHYTLGLLKDQEKEYGRTIASVPVTFLAHTEYGETSEAEKVLLQNGEKTPENMRLFKMYREVLGGAVQEAAGAGYSVQTVSLLPVFADVCDGVTERTEHTYAVMRGLEKALEETEEEEQKEQEKKEEKEKKKKN